MSITSKARTTTFALVAWLTIAASGATQETSIVSGVVRSTNGVGVVNARVRLVGGGRDTTVRTNARGSYAVVHPVGQIQITATMIGYRPFDVEVTTKADAQVDIVLQALPQQLASVNVRESWTGIRGIVGDDATMQPLPGVEIISIKQGIKVVTDSQGRFEFPLPKAERTTLRLSLPNYKTRPAVVSMDGVKSADLTLLLTRGTDANHLKTSLVDLDHRLSWGGIGMFVVDATQLTRHGAKNLYDGLMESGMLARKGIRLSGPCVFVDGVPRPDFQASQIPMARIEFVEVWDFGTEQTGTLAARWPGKVCGGSRVAGSKKRDGQWIAVWLRP